MPSTPVYRQIIADITNAIETGHLKPGERLPTMRELMARYECSDTPVKTALRLLEDQGLITTHQGRGTFVARK